MTTPAGIEPPRLKAKLRVQAALRACAARGLMATVARHGDDDAGVILVKQNLMGAGFRVFSPVRDAAGALAWMAGTGEGPVDEKAADAYIARQVDRDSDLWVIEIEDASGWLPFEVI
jgi:GMP synthase (glutamine-hydrolysing)